MTALLDDHGRANRPLRGIALALLAYGLFALSDATGKWLVERYPQAQILAINGVLGALLMAGLTHHVAGVATLWRTPNLKRHLIRGGLAMLNGSLVLYGLSQLSLASFYVLVFTSPFWITAISALILKEPVGVRRWAAIGVGFCGVLIAYPPGGGLFTPGALAVLLAALSYSGSLMMVRAMRSTDPWPVFGFFPLAAIALIWLPVSLIVGWQPLSPLAIGLLVTGTALVATGITCVSLAYRDASGAILAPFHYSQIIWGAALGFLIFADLPGWQTLAGAAVIIASGIYIAHRENRQSAAAHG